MPVSRKEFLVIQVTTECGFALNCVRDMTRTYSQMQHTDSCSEHSSIIWPVWSYDWAFVYELSGSGFESSCSHLNFRFCACFEQGVPWHSDNYRAWIHSEIAQFHDDNFCTVKCHILVIRLIFVLRKGFIRVQKIL